MHTTALVATLLVLAQESPLSLRELPPLLGRRPDPAKEPAPTKLPPFRVSGRAILIRYRGARGAGPQVTRTLEEARTLAGALLVLARSEGVNFAELASKWSEDATQRRKGGHLGTIEPRKDIPPLDRALFLHRVGAVIGPIETVEGFVIAQREPVEAFGYSQIVISWSESRIPPKVPRSRAQAEAAANALAAQAIAEPTRFDDLLRAESDDLGLGDVPGAQLPAVRGTLDPMVEEALLSMAVGDVAGPFELPSAFVIMRREKVEWVTLDTLLVQHRGARGAPVSMVRTREEAQARAQSLLEEARKAGPAFSRLSERESDDPADRKRGGRYTYPVSTGSPAWIREAHSSIKVGDVALLNSSYGFHIVRKRELERE